MAESIEGMKVHVARTTQLFSSNAATEHVSFADSSTTVVFTPQLSLKRNPSSNAIKNLWLKRFRQAEYVALENDLRSYQLQGEAMTTFFTEKAQFS